MALFQILVPLPGNFGAQGFVLNKRYIIILISVGNSRKPCSIATIPKGMEERRWKGGGGGAKGPTTL
jgi:hypothetical protein